MSGGLGGGAAGVFEHGTHAGVVQEPGRSHALRAVDGTAEPSESKAEQGARDVGAPQYEL